MLAPIDAAWFLQGPNLVYIVPLGAAVGYMTTYMATGIDFGSDIVGHEPGDFDAPPDADLDAHVDGHFDSELDASAAAHADVDAHADLDADADADLHGDAGHAATPDATVVEGVGDAVRRGAVRDLPDWKRLLLWMGVGQAPLTLLVMLFAGVWSVLGLGTHLALREAPILGSWAADAPVELVFSIPVAAFGALMVTRKVAFTLGKYAPTTKTTIQGKRSLVGLVGEAVMPIDGRHGMAMLRDQHGTMHQIHCRTSHELPEAIGKGRRIRTVAFDPQDDVFAVVECEETLSAAS